MKKSYYLNGLEKLYKYLSTYTTVIILRFFTEKRSFPQESMRTGSAKIALHGST
jgi:hypothetical protein